jgi:DNA (cytosine-5)-methyltransferase 1
MLSDEGESSRMEIDKLAISRKIRRFKGGQPLRVLDVFAGCGGLSLGFQAAGCVISGAVECDVDAARSHAMNFHSGQEEHARPRDITKITPHVLADELKLGDPALAIDVIVGGPPCQAFARVGRSKLREVAEHAEAYRHDPRARLYIDYLDHVDVFAPLAVVMENVPDMLNHGGHNIAAEVCEVLNRKGYACAYSLLNAAFYGVPQMRERMFLIAIRAEIAHSIVFPKPTHWIDLPIGYEGSRAVALKLLGDQELWDQESHYVPAPTAPPHLPPAVTTHEAIADLPAIYAKKLFEAGELKRGARRLNTPVKLMKSTSLSEYAQLMRSWPGFEGTDEIIDHVIRYLPRDFELFARLRPGDQYPQAFKLAEQIFAEAARKQNLRERSAEGKRLRAKIVPPYDPGKFPNKWRKLEPDKPSRTLLAHLGKDSYSHIHYDSSQARTISVREAARLQSFPDGFKFSGTMNPAFRQIGNAVPPLLARAIATCLLEQLKRGTALKPKCELKTALVRE